MIHTRKPDIFKMQVLDAVDSLAGLQFASLVGV